ncbi:MAG: class I SAM-dependent rRNA methyltransferase [Candidatus Zixiibacteriota bacterium]
MLPRIILKPGKDKAARHRHPWVFSGAIARIDGDVRPGSGEIVRVMTADGAFLAHGYYNPRSQIAIRLLEWNEAVSVDESWWRGRLRDAIAARRDLFADPQTNAFRLVHAEADGLPALIVDKYGDCLVIQSQAAGIDAVKAVLVDELNAQLHPGGIIERSEGSARELEGLAEARGVVSGSVPPTVEIVENGHRFVVDLNEGQKTGFYLDQRANRALVATHARDREVLDCFAYTGGFTVYALASGARAVTCVDSSAPALALLAQNVALNDIAVDRVSTIEGNAFEVLRKFRDQGRSFDMVILDPPKLAANRSQLEKALRAYKDLNLLAMKLLRPGGILATFSCSGAVSVAAFQEMIAWAATDAARSVQILRRLSQAADHPILVSFPESEYLKGLLCRAV